MVSTWYQANLVLRAVDTQLGATVAMCTAGALSSWMWDMGVAWLQRFHNSSVHLMMLDDEDAARAKVRSLGPG